MNNIKDSGGLFIAKGVCEPKVILNADVSQEGLLSKRDGFEEVVSLTNGHSLWSGATCILVMDGTTLKRLTGETLTTIEDIGVLVAPMYYTEVGDKVYLSNYYYNGIFDPDADTI